MGFKSGTRVRLDDALKMMMVKSANDIAVAVAEAVGGSVAGFAERMNAESQAPRHDPLALGQPERAPRRGAGHQRRATWRSSRARCSRSFPQHRDYYKAPGDQDRRTRC